MMKKRIFALLAIILFSTSCFAVIKELQKNDTSLVKVGASVVVPLGSEVKDAVAVGGNVTVYGKVAGDAVAVGGNVFLKETGKVVGDVAAIGGVIVKEPGAIVRGNAVEVAAPGVAPALNFFVNGGILKGMVLFRLISFVGFIVLTMIMVSLFMPQLGRASGAIESGLLRSFLYGLLIALLFLPIAIVLAISLIGIMLIPVWILLMGAAAFFGYFAAGHLLGKKALNAFRIYNKSMMVETLTGVLLLFLVGLLPFFGFFVKFIAGICGLGAVYLTRFGTK
ncbi:MAG: polymer-forming cytoskeletal protein [Syntrophales bacterium]